MKYKDMVDEYKKMIQNVKIENRYPYAFGMVQGAIEHGETPKETVEEIKAIFQAFDEVNSMEDA